MEFFIDETKNKIYVGRIIISTIVSLISIIILGMWGCPQYDVWQQGLKGQAELRRAEQNRKIKIQEAEAIKASSTLLAEAEVERSKGVAKANKIIGDSLRQNEEYLRYLWITDVAGKDIDKTVVYVPTEANIPIIEAGRLKHIEANIPIPKK